MAGATTGEADEDVLGKADEETGFSLSMDTVADLPFFRITKVLSDLFKTGKGPS